MQALDKQLMTPLSLASTFGYPDAVRQLLLVEADFMARDEEYQTPLHKAAAEGHLVCGGWCYYARYVYLNEYNGEEDRQFL